MLECRQDIARNRSTNCRGTRRHRFVSKASERSASLRSRVSRSTLYRRLTLWCAFHGKAWPLHSQNSRFACLLFSPLQVNSAPIRLARRSPAHLPMRCSLGQSQRLARPADTRAHCSTHRHDGHQVGSSHTPWPDSATGANRQHLRWPTKPSGVLHAPAGTTVQEVAGSELKHEEVVLRAWCPIWQFVFIFLHNALL